MNNNSVFSRSIPNVKHIAKKCSKRKIKANKYKTVKSQRAAKKKKKDNETLIIKLDSIMKHRIKNKQINNSLDKSLKQLFHQTLNFRDDVSVFYVKIPSQQN